MDDLKELIRKLSEGQFGAVILISSGSLANDVITNIMKTHLKNKIVYYMIYCGAVDYMKS